MSVLLPLLRESGLSREQVRKPKEPGEGGVGDEERARAEGDMEKEAEHFGFPLGLGERCSVAFEF